MSATVGPPAPAPPPTGSPGADPPATGAPPGPPVPVAVGSTQPAVEAEAPGGRAGRVLAGIALVVVLLGLGIVGVGSAVGWRVCTTDSDRQTSSDKSASTDYREHCRPLSMSDPLPLSCLIVGGVLALPFLLRTAEEFEFEGAGFKVAARRAKKAEKAVATVANKAVAAGQNAVATDVEGQPSPPVGGPDPAGAGPPPSSTANPPPAPNPPAGPLGGGSSP